ELFPGNVAERVQPVKLYYETPTATDTLDVFGRYAQNFRNAARIALSLTSGLASVMEPTDEEWPKSFHGVVSLTLIVRIPPKYHCGFLTTGSPNLRASIHVSHELSILHDHVYDVRVL